MSVRQAAGMTPLLALEQVISTTRQPGPARSASRRTTAGGDRWQVRGKVTSNFRFTWQSKSLSVAQKADKHGELDVNGSSSRKREGSEIAIKETVKSLAAASLG
ncbi:unnamed protein product [Pleuronectes platessa]|uniref:Uncharacterized protein n=1 Tax=Pleuronectes platessa TaxID=8262 RepID=A0A9N7UZL7_PLEPL|nr:unnamed protein product [Pleuronectes platessa]